MTIDVEVHESTSVYFPMQNRSKMCRSTSSLVRAADDLVEARARRLQIGEHELLRAPRRGRRLRPRRQIAPRASSSSAT